MGVFDKIFKTILTPVTAPLNALGGALSGSDESSKRADQMQWDLGEQRKKSKQMQLDLLGQMQAPVMSDAQQRRLKALEMESAPGPLVSDPLFQGDRATLVQGGAQALSGIQNQQRAYGTSGGFSNQGSINDVYDRLGAQLSQLGQQSRQVKEQKRDIAAEARQAFEDAKVTYQNSLTQARMAIESGDAAAASQAIQMAYQARENAANAQRAMTGQLLSIGGQLGSAALSGKPPIQSGGSISPDQAAEQVLQNPFSEQLSFNTNMPHSLMKKRANSWTL